MLERLLLGDILKDSIQSYQLSRRTENMCFDNFEFGVFEPLQIHLRFQDQKFLVDLIAQLVQRAACYKICKTGHAVVPEFKSNQGPNMFFFFSNFVTCF